MAVGPAAGQGVLEFLVADDAALVKAHQEHPSRLQAALLADAFGRQRQHAGLRCHHQLVVVGYGVAKGAQAVAVQHGAHVLAVGGQHHRRAVPGFHHAGMVFVEIFLGPGHRFVLVPRFGDHHQHGVGQFAAGHYQQFQGVVEAGGVAGRGVADGGQLVDVVPVQGRAELPLAGVHPVDVAAQGVDFPVVRQVAVGMRQFPVPQGIGAEAGMHQRKGGYHRGVVQVQVERSQLVGYQQSFIDEGVGAEAA